MNISTTHNASSASIQTGGGGGTTGLGGGDCAVAPSSATSSLISSATSGQMPDSLKGGKFFYNGVGDGEANEIKRLFHFQILVCCYLF